MSTRTIAALRYRWWILERGDIDATVAQVGFNLAQLVIPAFLLTSAGIPLEFSVSRLLPGYALGFLIGSLGLCFLAVRLARRENRLDVTAHVYGNNVPAIIAYTLSIMLPVYVQTRDPLQAWRVGAAAVIWTGLIKLAAAPFAGYIKKQIPSAAAMTVFGSAMYSYLALVLLQRIFDQPVVGLIALSIILTSVVGIPMTKLRIPPSGRPSATSRPHGADCILCFRLFLPSNPCARWERRFRISPSLRRCRSITSCRTLRR
jgi:adenine/guanine/hypoxanthine permease